MKSLKKILLIIVLCIPFAVKADITKYYIDATVLANGDLHVKEIFTLDGQYNGFERIINFKNPNTSIFKGDTASFLGSDIYNGDDISLLAIKAIDQKNLTFDSFNNTEDNFTKASYASSGKYGVYTESKTQIGYKYRIYNPSSFKKAFYIEYIIKNLGIVHNDVAEIGWNVVGDEFSENIKKMEVIIHIPDNTILRAWGHSDNLTDEVKLEGNDAIHLYISKVIAGKSVDVRFIFDKEVIKNSSKVSNTEALDKIVEIETQKANEANLKRKHYRQIIFMLNAFYLLTFIIIIIIIYKFYHKYDKEYKASFNQKYFRDFPADYGPEILGFLLNKRITSNEFSAVILNLICKKHIKVETLDKKDYMLVKCDSTNLLNASEQKVLDLLFLKISKDKRQVTLLEIKKYSKKNYDNFISSYTAFTTLAKKDAQGYHFYEEKNGVFAYVLSLIVILFLVTMTLIYDTSIFNIMLILIDVVALIYIISAKKRSKQGNEDYVKWIALKRFMEDFGRMDSKDLPEIYLWDKYLMYATILGCADKLSKTMKIKAQELYPNGYHDFDFNDFYMYTVFNRTINTTVSSSVQSAYNARSAASSSNSSGGGFGGGFSSGGGSFGGGGGGSRF